MKDKIIENLEITGLSSEGFGIGRFNKRVIFVPYALPQDVVKVRILRKKKKFFIGELLELTAPSPLRIKPACKHFGECGGCKWQHLPYEEQLNAKQEKVLNALERIAKLDLSRTEFRKILPAPEIFHYRNKVEFSFNASKQSLGFHKAGHWEEVVQIDECKIVPEEVNKIRNALREFCLKKGFPFWDPITHEGFLRQLVVRYAFGTKQIMLILITNGENKEITSSIKDFIAENFPEVRSLAWISSHRKNDSYAGLPYKILYGFEHIEETLGEYRFKISPQSFFQTNTLGAKQLYDVIFQMLPEQNKILVDLYCGTGSIGIYVSRKAEKVIGIEVIPEAVRDARQNALANELENVSFLRYDLSKNISEVLQTLNPDTVILDPPRAGLSKKLITGLLRLAPEHILYVSCNPATQARDLVPLAEKYSVLKIQPVDMFPHTPHIENVILLKRK